MKLHDLAPAKGSTRNPKRVGRGRAGDGGKTAGRGTKGARARSPIARHYEGGQIPLHMRLPKLGGFTRRGRIEFNVVNVEALKAFDGVVDPAALQATGLVPKKGPVKILGRGELDKALEVKANAFSASAIAKIQAAGGSAEVI